VSRIRGGQGVQTGPLDNENAPIRVEIRYERMKGITPNRGTKTAKMDCFVGILTNRRGASHPWQSSQGWVQRSRKIVLPAGLEPATH
jgi:hypothetical protein